jgi:hypothetical protein
VRLPTLDDGSTIHDGGKHQLSHKEERDLFDQIEMVYFIGASLRTLSTNLILETFSTICRKARISRGIVLPTAEEDSDGGENSENELEHEFYLQHA